MGEKLVEGQEYDEIKLNLQSLLENAEKNGAPLSWFEDLY